MLPRRCGADPRQAGLPEHPWQGERLSRAPALRMLPPALGALQGQVPLHLSGGELVVGQPGGLQKEICSASGAGHLAILDTAGTEQGVCGTPGGWRQWWGWAEPCGTNSSGTCGGSGVASQAWGAHPDGLCGGAWPALGLLGSRWALGMGQAFDSFSPPSTLYRRVVPRTGLEHSFLLTQGDLVYGRTAGWSTHKCSGPWHKHLPFSQSG